MDDVTEIAQLVVRERQSRVSRRADQLRDCFHPDATVTTSWLQGSAEAFASAAEGGSSAVNEWDTLHPAVPGTDLRVDPGAVAGLRHSYRWLAYTRSLEGETLSTDLLGIDRIDAVNALYAEAFTWLGAQLPDERSGE